MLDNKHNLSTYLLQLNMNGLEGRMFVLPSRKHNRLDILMVYDRHTVLEHYSGLAFALSKYGNVAIPDLPGFGGMDSFYKYNRKPSIENLADYLASYIKLRYKKRQFVAVGCGFGFVIITRTLQRYPELAKRVKLLISLGGYSDHEDLNLSRLRKSVYVKASRWLSSWSAHVLISYGIINNPLLAMTKRVNADADASYVPVKTHEDWRTHMYTLNWLMRFTNCKRRLDLPVLHIAYLQDDRYYHNNVEQHLGVIYNDITRFNVQRRVPSKEMTANRRSAVWLIPRKVSQALNNL